LYDGARDIYSVPERRMQDDDENLSNFTTTGTYCASWRETAFSAFMMRDDGSDLG
jgi:hypothetical protein